MKDLYMHKKSITESKTNIPVACNIKRSLTVECELIDCMKLNTVYNNNSVIS